MPKTPISILLPVPSGVKITQSVMIQIAMVACSFMLVPPAAGHDVHFVRNPPATFIVATPDHQPIYPVLDALSDWC